MGKRTPFYAFCSVAMMLLLQGCFIFNNDPVTAVIHGLDTLNAGKSEIIFGRGQDLMIIEPDGSGLDRLYPASALIIDLALSYDREKIACLYENGVIEILDREGVIMETLTQFNSAVDLGWTNDGSALWILDGNAIAFHGPAQNIPPVVFRPSDNPPKILAAALSAANNLAYVQETWSAAGGYAYHLDISDSGSVAPNQSWTNSDAPILHLHWSASMEYLTFVVTDSLATGARLGTWPKGAPTPEISTATELIAFPVVGPQGEDMVVSERMNDVVNLVRRDVSGPAAPEPLTSFTIDVPHSPIDWK